jgi:serine/threonine protein kinase
MVLKIPLDLMPPFQIQRKIHLKNDDLRIPLALLPKQYIDGSIRMEGRTRCRIVYGAMTNRGGYGKIYRAKRMGLDICVKIPHNPTFSMCSEAILQWVASETLLDAGIVGAVPTIYDIFQYAGETRIAMSYVEGVSSIEYILNSSNPERTFIQILAQISLLLAYLEETIRLDHRDLKADNVSIRNTPVKYEISLGGKRWTLSAPFQVVILDFGFGCLGAADGNAVVSLSDGILPLFDPCPKEGRDLFQFIASLWSFPLIRSRMTRELQSEIDLLLSYKDKPYASLIKDSIDTTWVYLLVSDSAFKHPPLHPLSLLHSYSIKYDYLNIQSSE